MPWADSTVLLLVISRSKCGCRRVGRPGAVPCRFRLHAISAGGGGGLTPPRAAGTVQITSSPSAASSPSRGGTASVNPVPLPGELVEAVEWIVQLYLPHVGEASLAGQLAQHRCGQSE